jgi:hypothetical protein
MQLYFTRRVLTITAALCLTAVTALAEVSSTITTSDPDHAGAVTVDVLDTNGGLHSTATANILATDTAASKATKIALALNAKFVHDHNDGVFEATVSGNVVTVTKVGGGGLKVTIAADGTGEDDKITIEPSFGNSEHWFWRFVRWVSISNLNSVPPANSTAMLGLDTPMGYQQFSLIGDGVQTLGQLQDNLSNQLSAFGITTYASYVYDDLGNEFREFASDLMPDSIPTLTPNTFQVQGTPGYADNFGTFGLQIQIAPLGTPFCGGDGSLPVPCPCGNFGMQGHGCNNSANTGGSILTACGITNPDTVVLSASGELNSSLSIFLQGSNTLVQPAHFGDGLRCIGGSLKRLAVKNALQGVVAYPLGNEQGIRARSAALGDTIPPGAMRFYQVYYRDPNLAFCPAPQGDSWNVSNALGILWQ